MAKIHDELKELEEKLAAQEEEVKNEVTEEVVEEAAESSAEAEKVEKAEEKPAEEVKAEEVKEEKTPSDYRRERLERKAREDALKAELDELKAWKASQEAKNQSEEDPEPDPTDEVEHLKWQNRQLAKDVQAIKGYAQQEIQQKAKQSAETAKETEFYGYESEAKSKYQDYPAVAQHALNLMATSVKMLYPSATPEQVSKAVKLRILERQEELKAQGYDNPVEQMYLEAKNMGYKPAAPANEEEVKPDLAAIKRNKERSTGMAATAGSGKADMTLEYMANLKPKEVAKLPKEDREKYFSRR